MSHVLLVAVPQGRHHEYPLKLKGGAQLAKPGQVKYLDEGAAYTLVAARQGEHAQLAATNCHNCRAKRHKSVCWLNELAVLVLACLLLLPSAAVCLSTRCTADALVHLAPANAFGCPQVVLCCGTAVLPLRQLQRCPLAAPATPQRCCSPCRVAQCCWQLQQMGRWAASAWLVVKREALRLMRGDRPAAVSTHMTRCRWYLYTPPSCSENFAGQTRCRALVCMLTPMRTAAAAAAILVRCAQGQQQHQLHRQLRWQQGQPAAHSQLQRPSKS